MESYYNDELSQTVNDIINESTIVVHFEADPDFVLDNYGALEKLGKFTEKNKIKGRYDLFELTLDKNNLKSLEKLVGKENITVIK